MVREALGPEKKEVFVSEADQQNRSSCRAFKYTDVLNHKDVQAYLCHANINIKIPKTFGFRFFFLSAG